MLEIKNIKKTYKTVGFEQKALDDVSVNFRTCEFAAILGPSGSGKTTFLNIIGGLDSYDSGDLIINERSTKMYKNRDWDSYRNHRVGFVFQNYNLITHQNVLKNVELALTLSGCSKDERRKRALKALKDVGLEEHVHKRPNQLSGGQMQRVAIARALINNPDIILADEPTGALDSDTSIQIMKLLKNISKKKLVIMVTHNPDLASVYATRIINLKDGKIISDSNFYDGEINTEETNEKKELKNKKTKMSFTTALSLSFNNLMTKKARTVLIAIASSIGIIGIALITAVSTGFQNYIDSIQEDTLTSYPLTIMQEQADITSMLLSIKEHSNENNGDNVLVEKQYISSMLSNISANDLKSFKAYLEDNYDKVSSDLANVLYSYSIYPTIYTIDSTNKLSKVNPSNFFTSMMGDNVFMNSYSSMASIFTEMVDNREELINDYDVLMGRWPQAYDEMIIVLTNKNSISDLLLYSLGLKDTEELSDIINSIMSGEAIDIKNEPLTITYEDLLNVDLRLIMPSDYYKYNSKYKIYENMSEDKSYMMNLYNRALKLKIVGVVSLKDGINSSSLNGGVAYTSALIDYIIEYATNSDIVKKQLDEPQINIFSGKKFDEKSNNSNLNIKNLVKIDTKKLEKAFNGKIDQKELVKKIEEKLKSYASSFKVDTKEAEREFNDNLNTLINGLFNYIGASYDWNEIDELVNNYLANNTDIIKKLSNKYSISEDNLKTVYAGLLKGLLITYSIEYNSYMKQLDSNYTETNVVKIDSDLKSSVVSSYKESTAVTAIVKSVAGIMSEGIIKKAIIEKLNNLTDDLVSSMASSYKIDEKKISEAFKLNVSENELGRIVSTLMSPNASSFKTNLTTLGYQDKEDPTFISFYFSSFDSKEHFLKFIQEYNNSTTKDKKINYTDTTGILMSSVRTIVNAVSYVLIAFVSISLIVSSIMIGVITYISVYERTKEIGILRAIGASKGNISSIFNAETFIIGLLSGLFGISVTYVLIPIINLILHHLTGNAILKASLEVQSALLLIGLAIILTIIGGLIPARRASFKDPVDALRSD